MYRSYGKVLIASLTRMIDSGFGAKGKEKVKPYTEEEMVEWLNNLPYSEFHKVMFMGFLGKNNYQVHEDFFKDRKPEADKATTN